MKVLIATQKPFAAVAVAGIKDILAKAGHEVDTLEKYAAQSDFVNAVAPYDALIIRSDKVTEEVLAAAPNLKIVVRAGAGVDNVDLEAAKARRVVVMNTPGQNSNAVAELCIAMMIFMSRTQFNPSTGTEIMGKRLGVQAYGQVGRLVGRKAEALGMKVSAIDPFIPADKIRELGAEPAKDVKALYAGNDFVSVHIPATPETIGSIGYELITSMPEGACLVNAARKEVIDEEGLARALEDRPDLKYVTDLLPDNYAALREKFGNRIFATPKKMGAQTAEANINAGIAAARQIADFFATGNTRFQVNRWE